MGAIMERDNQLKRITHQYLPEAVILRTGAIRFRHYLISIHALDRFTERCDRPATDIIQLLHDAVLACVERSNRPAIRRVIRVAESRGGYVLMNKLCYFIISPDAENGLHVVSTVMTPRQMKWTVSGNN